jgi:microcystin-dependent protein
MTELNIDINNNKNLTIIIIGCILLFACVYIMIIRKNKNEGFIDYPLEAGDTVSLKGGLRQIKVGSLSTSPDAIESINNLINAKILENDIMNKINRLETSNQLPAYSIVAYNGTVAPNGWQICDGSDLKYSNVNQFVLDSLQNKIKIPDLRGRVIIGTNTTEFNDTNNNKISVRVLNQTGGMEKVALDKTEMPAHRHETDKSCMGADAGGYDGKLAHSWGWNCTTGQINYISYEGGDPNNKEANNVNKTKQHENMQPFMVLNYIMKQPIKA